MRRRRICEWTGKIPITFPNAERITIVNNVKNTRDRLVTNVADQCAGDKVTVEFSPKEGADFITFDAEFMNKISINPTVKTPAGTYGVKFTRTSVDGKQ